MIITNKHAVSEFFYNAIVASAGDYDGGGADLTASGVTNPIQQTMLKKPYEND